MGFDSVFEVLVFADKCFSSSTKTFIFMDSLKIIKLAKTQAKLAKTLEDFWCLRVWH